MTDAYITVPRPEVKEGSSFNATAYFRNGATSSTPSNAYYRVDCLKTGTVLQGWTALSASTSITIAMTSTFNAIQDQNNDRELKQLTIAADYGLSTENRDAAEYWVKNLQNI